MAGLGFLIQARDRACMRGCRVSWRVSCRERILPGSVLEAVSVEVCGILEGETECLRGVVSLKCLSVCVSEMRCCVADLLQIAR